ncbi:MAG: DUF5063 domain-containing protein [Bifidobacteriaceae bacterium]|jgi:hypothetical protein|nr:DUF5063 domain-containing protein [Bifidobacteriaceae bacterium]
MNNLALKGGVAEDAAKLGELFRNCLEIYTEVASGLSPETALPLLAWATSDACVAAARIGAVSDVEAPATPLAPPVTYDLDALRRGLANVLDGIDLYLEVDDPRGDGNIVEASITEDILTAVSAFQTGLAHLDGDNPAEALWWWQYSCFATWGERVTSALHMIQSLLSEARLVTDHEAAAAIYRARLAARPGA